VHEPRNAHEKWLFPAAAERVLEEQPGDEWLEPNE